MATQVNLAFNDVLESLQKCKLWLYLGWSDIQLRYKGSVLGPLWITLSMSIFIVMFGFVYGNLLHQNLDGYIPFLTCGILIWTYISTILVDSCDVFLNAKTFVCQIKLPYLIHIYRIIWRNMIILLHNSIVYIVVALYFQVVPNLNTLLFIPGFLLLTMNLTFLSLFLGVFAARYRDIPPVINSIIQIAFFVSPITWMPNLLGSSHAFVVQWNPLNYFLDIVRSPLLGQAPEPHSWLYCLLITLLLFCLISPFFIINRRNIPFWL